ncbi:MAG: LTA synthase family protein [Paludibacter sp.]|nr:LTA synthase family protein [Paludibacter sp.]
MKNIKNQPTFALLYNLVLILIIYYICRIAFFVINKSYFTDVSFSHLLTLLKGGFQFDIFAIMYTNLLYIVMQLVPFKFRLNTVYQTVAKWTFVVPNSIAVLANCCDIVYFPFTNQRATKSIFLEFHNENNILQIITNGIVGYWYVTLLWLLLMFCIYKLYYRPKVEKKAPVAVKSNLRYYGLQTVLMFVLAYFVITGMRGGFAVTARPIMLSHANKYVNKNTETAIVLNTPYCLLRTSNKKVFKTPEYFKTEAEMAAIYSPIHQPANQEAFKPLNVVIIILESFGKEYSGFFNANLDNGTYKGYTPFLDSLYAEGLTFEYSYANGRRSIDAMPSVLASIPMFVEPFFLTPYSTADNVNSIASILKDKGYYSAFFHGAPNGSLGFQAFAKKIGFDAYFGFNEYGDPKNARSTWGIWDEEFLQFYADKMATFEQPFVTSIFTTTSHHPFKIPARYEGQFAEGTQPIHKGVRYTDYALKQFFGKMAQYDWYKNTLFVITADHTSQTTHAEYFTDINRYSVPILFYHPDSDLKGFVQTMPVQQIDILPSILSYLNYDKPYFAFGQDIFNTATEDKFVANYNNPRFQFIKHNYFLEFNGEKIMEIYKHISDPLLQNNLVGKVPEQSAMETQLKAVIQQYMMRMNENRLY